VTAAGSELGSAAARAALAVPGVRELQPSLRQVLVAAARRVQQAHGDPAADAGAGVRVERTPRTGVWNVEVRCVVAGERRALEVAQDIRSRVRAAVCSQLALRGTPARVDVAVTVTRTVAGSRAG
jgi:uncharacterized alkaline shock family protein YloU